MQIPIKPIYLFADSQLLFWKKYDAYFLQSIAEHIEKEEAKAAYIAVSNDERPEFFDLFRAAMEIINITDCRMIGSKVSVVDEVFLNNADLILLSGGDVLKGWQSIERSGLKETIVRKYYEGSVLLGVSAGAVQLGLGWLPNDNTESAELIYTFKLIPFLIDVHDRSKEWSGLKKALHRMGGPVKGIGIPAGGGLIYHSDHSIEAIRHPVYEFSFKEEQLISGLIFPPEE